MPKNSFLSALFSGPKFSLAPIDENNRGSLKIGKIVPVWSTVLNPREGVTLDMGSLVRFMPAQAPIMEGYKVTFDAFAVPYSALGYAERKERDIDDFFNIKENGGEIENPFCFPFGSLPKFYEGSPVDPVPGGQAGTRPSFGQYGLFKKGSLSDYLNFPSLKACKEHVRKWLSVNPLLTMSGIERFTYGTLSDTDRFAVFALLNDSGPLQDGICNGDFSEGNGFYLGLPFSIDDSPVVEPSNADLDNSSIYWDASVSPVDDAIGGIALDVRSLLGYIFMHYPRVAAYYGFTYWHTSDSYDTYLQTFAQTLAELNDNPNNSFTLDFLQVLYDFYKIDVQSIYNEYFDYVCDKLFYNSYIVNCLGNTLYSVSGSFLPSLTSDEPVDLSYHAAYWKIISDWYINTNIDGDPEDFFLKHCSLLSKFELPGGEYNILDIQPFNRRWSNDVFTSAVPEALVQNVRIPVDGTIPDLREANAYQKLVDIFRNTGRRLRDVIYGIFGITPSAVRSEMSEPVGSLSTWIGMQSVLQTSQTTPDSPQAAYAGIGTDSSGFKHILKYVNNDEPTPVIIMVLMSVTQRASYMQGFDRKFFRKSIYDFAVPQLAMIGEQEVTNKEVYFDKGYSGGIFGFNRRYYDWFASSSQVHGDLRESLDYWHGARIFDDVPSLNSEFIGIDSDADHLQRGFANVSESADSIIYNLSFNGYKTVALPRYIQYEL